MDEQWKQINGFDDYEISNRGKVRSNKGNVPVILKERITHDGYVWYNLCRNGKGYTKRANRLVAEAFINNPESKPTVNHIDGNKHNNRVENLEWATRQEQMRHAYSIGLKKPVSGIAQVAHKLSEENVRQIRKIYKAHSREFGMKSLAKRYGVSESVIDRCIRRETYKNVI